MGIAGMLIALAMTAGGCNGGVETPPSGPSGEAKAAAKAPTNGPAPSSEAAGAEPAGLASGVGETVLRIEGMVCQGCAETAKSLLESLPGVASAEVSLQDGTARVRYDMSRTTPKALASALQGVDRGEAPAFRVTVVEGGP